MSEGLQIVQYWGGCPQTANSKWQRFLHLARACIERGWRTHMVWTRQPDDDALWSPFEQCGCRFVLQPRAKGNFDLACMWRSRRLFKQIGCDVLHCHNVHTSPLIGGRLAGVPVRVWSKLSMSPYYEQGIEPTGIHRLALSTRTSCRMAHRVLALSAAVSDELTQTGIDRDKIAIVPGPVELDRYGSVEPIDRQKLGVNPEELVITTVGHAVRLKGWDVLIDAFAVVVRRHPRAVLLLVGSTEGPHEVEFADALRRRVAQLGLTDRVRILGRRDDVPQILAASDIFAFPSRSDGQGLALTEAMAAGMPCIASASGGIVELIEHRVNGLLFERENADELAEGLLVLASDRDLRLRLAGQAKQSAQRFGMNVYVETVIEHYQQLLAAAGLGERV